MKKHHPLTLFAFLSLSLFLVGCFSSGEEQPELAPVTGTVSFDGEVAAGGTITFTPEKGRASNATIDENGNYELFYKVNVPGAVIGKHSISITMVENMDLPADKQIVIPAKFNTNTTLEMIITDTNPVTKDFDLKTKK